MAKTDDKAIRTAGRGCWASSPAPLFLAAGLYAFMFGVVGPLTPLFITSLGGSALLVGAYQTVGTGANAIARSPAGRLADKIGRPWLVLAGLTVACLGVAILAAATRSAVTIMAGVLVGVGAASFWPSIKAYAIELRPDDTTKSLGRMATAQESGTAMGQIVAGLLLATVSLRSGLLLSLAAGGMGVGVAAIMAWRWRHSLATAGALAKASSAAPMQSRGAVTTSRPWSFPRPMLAGGAALFMLGFIVGSFLPFLALYFDEVLDAPPVSIGIGFAAFSVSRAAAGVAANPLLGRLDRSVASRNVVPLLLIGVSGLFFVKGVAQLVAFILAGTFVAFLFVVIHVRVLATVSRLDDSQLAGRIGTMEATALFGAMAGPVFGGVVYGWDPSWLFPLCGVLTLTAAGLVYAMGGGSGDIVESQNAQGQSAPQSGLGTTTGEPDDANPTRRT